MANPEYSFFAEPTLVVNATNDKFKRIVRPVALL
jgi:hypothetical protein